MSDPVLIANCAHCRRPFPTTMAAWEAGKKWCNNCTRRGVSR